MGALAPLLWCVCSYPQAFLQAADFTDHLPACSLLANYKLSDLYSLTSTRQRQARQTSVGDMPPSAGVHFQLIKGLCNCQDKGPRAQAL